MGLEASIKEEREPIIVEILEYENLAVVLSRVIVPFSEMLATSKVPDVYLGHEKIPFKQRDPLYKSIMRKEFSLS
jgi:hypothetical protein